MTTHDPELIRVLRNIKPDDPATTTKAGTPNLNYLKEKLGRAIPRDEALAAWAEISGGTTKEPEAELAASNDEPAGDAGDAGPASAPGDEVQTGDADQAPVQGEGDKTAESQLSEVKQAGDEKPLLTQPPIANGEKFEPEPAKAPSQPVKAVRPRRVTFSTAG